MPLMWTHCSFKRSSSTNFRNLWAFKMDGLLKQIHFQKDFVSPKLWRANAMEPIIRFLLDKFPWFLGLWWNFCIESNLNSMYSEMVKARMQKHPLIFIVKQHKYPTQKMSPTCFPKFVFLSRNTSLNCADIVVPLGYTDNPVPPKSLRPNKTRKTPKSAPEAASKVITLPGLRPSLVSLL